MSGSNGVPTVWNMANGEKGDQLPHLNSKQPFPPEPGSDGWIAMGWPGVGDMRIWDNDHGNYSDKFRLIYPQSADLRVGMPWQFAFSMRIGDLVVCPCSSARVLLVGCVIGNYEYGGHIEFERSHKLRFDFVHFRPVRWSHSIPSSDPLYGMLNRVGLLTLSRSKKTSVQLHGILNQAHDPVL
jgi:hypothetical protein